MGCSHKRERGRGGRRKKKGIEGFYWERVGLDEGLGGANQVELINIAQTLVELVIQPGLTWFGLVHSLPCFKRPNCSISTSIWYQFALSQVVQNSLVNYDPHFYFYTMIYFIYSLLLSFSKSLLSFYYCCDFDCSFCYTDIFIQPCLMYLGRRRNPLRH